MVSIKEGKPADSVSSSAVKSSSRRGPQNNADVYAKALNSGNQQNALQIIKDEDPKSFNLHYHKLNRNVGYIFASKIVPYKSTWRPESFRVTPLMDHWVKSNIFSKEDNVHPYRPKSIIIEGPSGIGKTAWARSLGVHNYFSGRLDFNKNVFSNEATYNIIDNINPRHLKLKHWKELIGAKTDWQSNCKYGKPVLIKGGIPAIVLCNPGKGASYRDFLDKKENAALRSWTIVNAEFEFITNPLYDPTPSQTQCGDHSSRKRTR